jgi:protein-L-isoaspartate(D-aspartate) O-methyltransferase
MGLRRRRRDGPERGTREDPTTRRGAGRRGAGRERPAGDRVADAFRATPRTEFLPADQLRHAADDRPLPLGRGQTSSQPSTVLAMLRLLDVPEGARVLDVGSGSGWTTALLAHLVGPTGRVEGREIEPELARWGAANLAASDRPWARILPAPPGVLGAPDEAPFDRVLVSAEARELPQGLLDQLAVGGRMVAPVRGEMLCVVRTGPTSRDVTTHGGYRFVPLR